LDLVLSAVYDGRPNDFYWGTGNGSFTLDSYHAGITTTNGWGMAAADFDHDGDVDLFSERVFRNDIPNQNKGHWLQVHVTGATANNAAIGSTVRVTTGTTTRMRHVQGGTGKGGQDSLYLHFGLATATTVDEISVTFPGGHTVTFAGPFAVDQRLFVKEDVASPVAAWAPPF
ncbi:MAG TPA: CRTAC1 family protein, partial [Sorangium sp.]|nr:CRTAC1 family protein [Sorangium sp.]